MRLAKSESVMMLLRATVALAAGKQPGMRATFRDLGEIEELRTLLNVLEHQLIEEARETGLSWSDVGGILGISKQAAQQKYSRIEL